MSNPLIVVLGAGPGVGTAVGRAFGRRGYDVALLARDAERLERLAHELHDDGITTRWAPVDLTDEEALRQAVTEFGEHGGRIDVLHFNPSAFRQRSPLELTPAELLEDVRLGVAPLLTAVQAARPYLSPGARVTATGSMAADRPWHEAPSLGVQKASLRNLVRSLDAALRGDGIRATCVTVNGTLGEDPFTPDRVAEAVYAAATRPEDRWQVEVPYPQ